MISGANAMVKCLKEEGISVVFGYPGATIAPFYDALASSDIEHVLTRTEQGAGHSASGYARVTGKPGVCIATSGPGATNLFTAIATAYSDSVPMVAITGQVATWQLGHDVFQEVDTTGAVSPFTKHCYLVKSANDICRIFKEAFHIANTGRKGPVLIDVPVDIQREMIEYSYPKEVSIRGYKPSYKGHPLQISKVAEAIEKSRKPLICCGGGVLASGAQQAMISFCESNSIPVVSTMMGIGAMPPKHKLYYGMLGQSGIKAANLAVKESDLLILIGARVGDRAIVQPSALEKDTTIIHIDIDSAEIGKNMGTTIPLVGDANLILEQLCEKNIQQNWQEWIARLESLREPLRRREGLDPNIFVKMLCESMSDSSVYVADVGQNQIWSARNYCVNGSFLTTGGMGTMGYSIPAAVGAKMANKEKTVVAVCGDGSFQMSMNELATICQQKIAVKVVVMRNGVLGMVKEIQHNVYGGRESAISLDGSPEPCLIAKAYGIDHHKIDKLEEAQAAIDKMLSAPGPYLLECTIDPKEASI